MAFWSLERLTGGFGSVHPDRDTLKEIDQGKTSNKQLI